MNLLLLTEEAWNDKMYPNNVLTNWFGNYDDNLANIYLASGSPYNSCCSQYFQLTDKMAVTSRIMKKNKGKWLINRTFSEKGTKAGAVVNVNSNGRSLRYLKYLKAAAGGPMRLLRDFAWLHSKWEGTLLTDFLAAYKPDVIFSLRFYSRRMLYMEKLLHEMTGAPVVVFTGDDEYSLKQLNLSPFYWGRKLLFRQELRRNAMFYEKFYTLSLAQSKKISEELGVASEVLYKGGEFPEKFTPKAVATPVRIVYAGRLYCNRDKILMAIAKAISEINKDEIKMILHIYTKDSFSKKQSRLLEENNAVFLKGFITADRLKEVYKEADIALHAESFDIRYRWLLRYSFSTKIVDCLGSTCAVLAVGHSENEGIRYLRRNRGAICIQRKREIYPVLSQIASHPDRITLYQKKAWELGVKAHRIEAVRNKLNVALTSIAKK